MRVKHRERQALPGHNSGVMRLSVQLYTLRQPLADDVEGTLHAVRDMGFDFVELAGYNGLSAEAFKNVLDDCGLKVSAGHWGLADVKEVERVSLEANLFGCKHIVLPWISQETYQNGWVEFGKELEPLARGFDDRGHTFSYHNHAFEFEPNEHSTFSEMWEQTEPILKAQLDLGWLAVAGQNPVDWINKLGARCPLVHLKDFSGNKESHDAEAGKGTIDWDAVIAACKSNGVEFGSIEMDHTPDEPLVSVRRSVEYFQSKGLT
jgi:sugar phosphate isomerase/epimerase